MLSCLSMFFRNMHLTFGNMLKLNSLLNVVVMVGTQFQSWVACVSYC